MFEENGYDPDEAIKNMHPELYEENEVGLVDDNVRNDVIGQVFGTSNKQRMDESTGGRFNKESIQSGLTELLESNGYNPKSRTVQEVIGLFLENLSRVQTTK